MRKADNLTTILCRCHVIWEPKLPGTLWAPRACNGTDLPFTLIEGLVVEIVTGYNYKIQFYDTLAAVLYTVRVTCS